MRFLAGVAGGADSLIIDMFKKIARKNNTFSATTPEARAAARLEAFTAARRFEVSLPACQPASLCFDPRDLLARYRLHRRNADKNVTSVFSFRGRGARS